MVLEPFPTQVSVSDSGPSRASSMMMEVPQHSKKQPTLDFEDLEDEAASINIVPAVRLQVWGGLLERRGYEVTDGEIMRSPTKSPLKDGTSSRPDAGPSKAMNFLQPRHAGSFIAAVRSTNSFAPAEQASTSNGIQRPLPFKRVTTSNAGFSRSNTPANQPPHTSRHASVQPNPVERSVAGPSSVRAEGTPAMPLIFAGMKLCALGEARTPAVKEVIEKSGGIYVLEEDDHSVDFIVVRLLRYVVLLISYSQIQTDEMSEVEARFIVVNQTPKYAPSIGPNVG